MLSPAAHILQLEAENARLRQELARQVPIARLTALERDLRSILDNMPSMIGYWDRDLRNRFGNHAYFDWFGVDPTTMPGKHIRDVIGEERYKLNLPYIEGVLRGEPQQFERAIPSPDGKQLRHSLANYIPDLVDGEVRGFYVLVTDITAVKTAEEALRISEERYRKVLEDQTEVISRLRTDGTLVFVNEVYCRFFGKQSSELIGHKWMPVCHPDDLSLVKARLETLTPQNPVVVIENRVYAGDGQQHWMQFVNRGFFEDDGKLREIQSVGREITRSKQAEAALQEVMENLELRIVERTEEVRQLAVQTTLAEERERQAIARDLHDDLGQRLHIVLLKLDALAKKQPEIADEISLLRREVTDASRIARSLTSQLSPTVLHDLGLGPALLWLGEEMKRLYGLEVEAEIEMTPAPPLSSAQSAILFRAVRELLINIVRHARTTRARLVARMTAGQLLLLVEDGGVGMSGTPLGFGLTSVRERLAFLGGTMDIESPADGGSRIALTLPLAHLPVSAQETT